MRKRIALLLTALMLALSMAMGAAGAAFADPNCDDPKHADHPNCVTRVDGPGGSENSNGRAAENNPNFTTETNFEPPGRS